MTTLLWRNSHQFSDAVPRTRHQGHPVVRLDDDSDQRSPARMVPVLCVADGDEFEALPGELVELVEPPTMVVESYRLGDDGKFWPAGYNDSDDGTAAYRADPPSAGYSYLASRMPGWS